MNIKPLGDTLVVKMLESETMVGGVIIPDNAKEKPQEGEVLAVGSGRYIDGVKVPLEVKVGDRVLVSKYGGSEVKYKGEKFTILREAEVLAILE